VAGEVARAVEIKIITIRLSPDGDFGQGHESLDARRLFGGAIETSVGTRKPYDEFDYGYD
jgi:hypothetical protein